MTWGLVASFGGLLVAFAVLALWEHFDIRAAQKRASRATALQSQENPSAEGIPTLESVVARIADAERASRQAADDLAAIRQQLSTR
jgi:hypothetical protein